MVHRPVHPRGLPAELPLVGRETQVRELFSLFGTDGSACALRIICGESGVGKSRLARTVAAEAERRGWRVLRGRAYPVEQGVPYAVLADAFVPHFQSMESATLTVLSRGRDADLHRLFPALAPGDMRPEENLEVEELRTRLQWTFSSVLGGIAKKEPLLVVLEDLHWADSSSIALIHFILRRLDDHPVRFLATYTTEDRRLNPHLLELERSLLGMGLLERMDLPPLELEAIEALLTELFGMTGQAVSAFAQRLFGWTRGNVYFVEQTLKALIQSGDLHRDDGSWLGWEARELRLPATIRDAILARFSDVDPVAREVADVMAVVGRPALTGLLERVLARDRAEVSHAVQQLRDRALIEEDARDEDVLLRFFHPLTRETIYRSLSLTRRRLLHEQVAEGLEQVHGENAAEHADEIAYHLVQTGPVGGDPRAARYLSLAGGNALERHADQEAVGYLGAALEALERKEPGSGAGSRDGAHEDQRVRRALVRAQLRTGQYGQARRHLNVLAQAHEARGEDLQLAEVHRRLGLASYWEGRHDDALEHLAAARLAAPEEAFATRAHIELAAGTAFQQLGRPEESRERILESLEWASRVGDPSLLGRAHRALALVSTWVGRTEEAREHGLKAVELGEAAGDPAVVFWGRWALASLEGLVRGPEPMRPWLERARASAEELGSPVLALFVDELELEYAYFVGAWDDALALGTRAIHECRLLHQHAILVRMLVWTASVYIGRGDLDRATELVDEAAEVAGLHGSSGTARDVHAVVPALIGRATLAMARGDLDAARAAGNSAFAMAEASRYVIWILHRLLPALGEASIRARDLDRAAEIRDRLEAEGQRMGHELGLVWARAATALITWHSGGNTDGAAEALGGAADAMEEMGIVFEAARVRRQFAGRLAALGRREEAADQLRRVHDTFERLGAEPELALVRRMFREIQTSVPRAHGGRSGAHAITRRQYEIAQLIAERCTNKDIARRTGLKVRTVTTHLSNIYHRLELEGSAAQKRAELGDMVREGRIQASLDD